MESQRDTLKVVYKHHQHARIQKEGDDIWISSEDLRTEGSSDEDAPHSSCRGHRLKKNKKQRKSTSSDTSKENLTTRPTYPMENPSKDHLGSCSTEVGKSSERFPILQSPFFADVFPESPAGTSGISLGSSDSGMDALNLESRWRPKRGSLKYPILVEGTSVEV